MNCVLSSSAGCGGTISTNSPEQYPPTPGRGEQTCLSRCILVLRGDEDWGGGGALFPFPFEEGYLLRLLCDASACGGIMPGSFAPQSC